MSTIVNILRATEEVQLPDGSTVLASEEALRQTLRESLRLERQRRLAPANQHQHHDARPARSGDARSGGARDTDTGRPEVRVVGQVPQPTKPVRRSVRSMKSPIVPEPDQLRSERPEPRSVTGPLEPRG
jgi:hypothetical protein